LIEKKTLVKFKSSSYWAQDGRSTRGELFLRTPMKSDEISLCKAGGNADPISMMALYRSPGLEEGVTSPVLLDGYMAVVVLQDMDAFVLRRNNKNMKIPPCRRGTIGFQDMRHSYSSGKYPVCSFSFVLSKAFLEEVRPRNQYYATDLQEASDYSKLDDTLLHLASSIVPILLQPAADRLFVDQIFLAASIYLISKFGKQGSLDSRRGGLTPRQEKIAKEFLAANIGENVSLEQVARLCEVSAPTFARLFKRSTGMTPYRWFTLRRLAQAKYLLESSDDSLVEIGLACGFADHSHFTRTFSRLVGVSPRTWRRLEER
jgi:AraC family transcriptional regulator